MHPATVGLLEAKPLLGRLDGVVLGSTPDSCSAFVLAPGLVSR